MESPFRERLFSPDEVRRVVRRAAELSSQAPADDAPGRPLTQDELERHAADLGLSAGHVRQAIAQPTADHDDPRAPPSFWTGTPIPLVYEDVLPHELSDEGFAELTGTIRWVLGVEGEVQRDGPRYAWRPPANPRDPPRPLAVTALSLNGITRVRIEERLGPLAGGLIGGVGLGAGLPVGALIALAIASASHDASRGVAFGLLFAMVLTVSMLFTVRAVARRRARELERLRSALREVLQAPTSRLGATATAPSGVRIALDQPAASSSAPDDATSTPPAEAHRSERR